MTASLFPRLQNLQNITALAARALRPGRNSPDSPYKINLMVTSRCNQRCSSCRIWARPAEDLPLGLLSGLLASVPSLSWLDLTGGEILLRPDIEEVVETILRRCRRLALLHFPTNGSLPERAAGVARLALSGASSRLIVTVSLDGPPDLHDALRGKEGAWSTAMETFLRLKELDGCGVLFGMTLTEDNLEAYAETLDAARKAVPGLRPSDIHVNIAHSSSHYYGTKGGVPLDAERAAAAVKGIARARGRSLHPVGILEGSYLRRAPQYLKDGKCPVPCRALAATCFVDVTGAVYPCVSWDMPLGNLKGTGGDLRPIWNGSAASSARELIREENCPGCWTPCEAAPAILADLSRPGRR